MALSTNTVVGAKGALNNRSTLLMPKPVMPFSPDPSMIVGVTRDANSNPLGGCTVKLFRTADDSLVCQTTSDANGNFSIPASGMNSHYLVCYKAGVADVMGSTVNTLTGA